MINTISSQDFRQLITNWTNKSPQQSLRKHLDQTVLAGKEILHGVRFTEDPREQVQQCITDERQVRKLLDVKDLSEITEEDLFTWYVKTYFDCAQEALKKATVQPEANPTPLTDRTIWRLWDQSDAVIYFFDDSCLACHAQLEKKMCGARHYSPNVYTASREARALLDDEVVNQIEKTPSLFHYRQGRFTPVDMEEYFRIVAENCPT